MIEIEKNIPIPEKNSFSDQLRKMEIGDSFVISLKERGKINGYSVNLGIKFTSKKISDTDCRVWRIA